MGYHHNPVEVPLFDKEAAVVNVANDMSKSMTLGSSGELRSSEYNDKVLGLLGVENKEFLLSIIDKVQEEYQAILETFLTTQN